VFLKAADVTDMPIMCVHYWQVPKIHDMLGSHLVR